MQKMNDLQKQRVYHKLGELGIRYVKHEHRAVFTCEEADKYSEGIEGAHCKNLFLRNAKGKRQYLVILANGKMADLSALKKLLGEKRLSFASDKRLMEYMGVASGAVSVFNLINDVENMVEIVIDESLGNAEKINFHPNDNTETLTISYRDFLKFLKAMGKEPRFINMG